MCFGLIGRNKMWSLPSGIKHRSGEKTLRNTGQEKLKQPFCSQNILNHNDHLQINELWGAWVAQAVESPTSAQVMISQSVSLSPASGSVLAAQSLEPASDSLSDPPSFMLCFSLSQK